MVVDDQCSIILKSINLIKIASISSKNAQTALERRAQQEVARAYRLHRIGEHEG